MNLQTQGREEKAFAVLMAAFVVVLVLTNVIGVKLFLAFPNLLPNGFFGEPITLTTGILTYPVTFLLTDVVCEVYGSKRAKLMVLTGFVMSLLSLVLIQLVKPAACQSAIKCCVIYKHVDIAERIDCTFCHC